MADRVIPIFAGKLPSEQALRKLVRDGYGSNQIADRFGVKRDYVRSRLKSFGLAPPADRQPPTIGVPRTMQFHGPGGPVTLPRISIISDLERYS